MPLPKRVTCPEIAGHGEIVNRLVGDAGTFTVVENSGIGPLLESAASCGLKPLKAPTGWLAAGMPVMDA